MLPGLRIVECFGHKVSALLFRVDVFHHDSWVGTHLEEPVNVNTVRAWQVAESHTARLFDQFDHCLVVFGNDEASSLLRPPNVGEVFGGVEAFAVRI